jgi:hypothetical protein
MILLTAVKNQCQIIASCTIQMFVQMQQKELIKSNRFTQPNIPLNCSKTAFTSTNFLRGFKLLKYICYVSAHFFT